MVSARSTEKHLPFKHEWMFSSSLGSARAFNLDLQGTPFLQVTGNLAFSLSSGALWWWIMYGASAIQTPVHWEPNQSPWIPLKDLRLDINSIVPLGKLSACQSLCLPFPPRLRAFECCWKQAGCKGRAQASFVYLKWPPVLFNCGGKLVKSDLLVLAPPATWILR